MYRLTRTDAHVQICTYIRARTVSCVQTQAYRPVGTDSHVHARTYRPVRTDSSNRFVRTESEVQAYRTNANRHAHTGAHEQTCAADPIQKGALLLILSPKCVQKRVLRLRAPLFCTARFHDYSDEKHLFMNSFVPYINYLRFVWVPLGCISLAIAHERTMFPRFCICVSHRR